MSDQAFNISLAMNGLTVARAGNVILAGVSAELAPGDALVLRGANGSGKTSLLRALAGFARIVKGEVNCQLDGNSLHVEDLLAEHLHFLGHENGISSKLSVMENLKFWQALIGTDGADPQAICDQVGLGLLAKLRAGRLSAGQKRRLALGRLLLAPRAIWLLDEPATALDKEGQALLQKVCASHRANGGIIILTTHGSFTLPDARGLQLMAPEAAA